MKNGMAINNNPTRGQAAERLAMQAILALPALSSDTTTSFKVGDLVANFNTICRVIAADDGIRGMLVRIIDGGGKGSKFYADPKLCRPVR